MGARHSSQAFDAALARFGRLMAQMRFDGITNRRTIMGLKVLQVLHGFRGEDDLESHSGYIIARINIWIQDFFDLRSTPANELCVSRTEPSPRKSRRSTVRLHDPRTVAMQFHLTSRIKKLNHKDLEDL